MAEQKLSVEVGQFREEALDKLTINGRSKVKRGRSISSEDTRRKIQPEEFTKKTIINRVLFDLFDLERQPGEKKFKWSDKDRSVDYALENQNGDAFIVEAKPINGDLTSGGTSSAVEQVKDVFDLRKGHENYEFGVATDGLRWIIINNEGEVTQDLELEKDIFTIGDYIQGRKKPVSEKRQEEITDKFYKWYDALLHGGKYKDREGETRHVAEEDAFVNNISYAREEDKPEIAQTIANRLIFVKFLQSKEIIGEDILADLKELEEKELNSRMKELFFQVMNTPEDERMNPTDEFEDIPYLNGSLFKRNDAEKQNPDYKVNYEILSRFVDFLDRFAFVNKESLEEKEAIDPKILGYIFERAMTSDERKDTGAYYTPRAVTEYIAKNTVYPTLLEKSNRYLKEEKGYKESELPETYENLVKKISPTSLSEIRDKILIKEFKVVDPACGSGAFLLSVANILWDIHRNISERIDSNFDIGGGNADIWIKKQILRHNIYGVDINHNATEIARLRLWLWLVDSFNSNNLEALPNIDYNIVSGNSLTGFIDITKMKEEGKISGQNRMSKWLRNDISEVFKTRNEKLEKYKHSRGEEADRIREKIEKLQENLDNLLNDHYVTYALDDGVDLSEEEIKNFGLFHWGAEFSKVYDPEKSSEKRGFDVVVGNPPYIKYRKIPEKQRELLGEIQDYETPFHKYDISLPFVERSQDLMSEDGELGFIMTKKWLKSHYGEYLRKKLKEEQSVNELIDFTDQQVFKGVTTYTLIILINQMRNETVRYGRVDKLDNDVREKLSKMDSDIDTDEMVTFDATYENLNSKKWSFVEETKAEMLNSDYRKLNDYVHMFQGIKTGKNPVFVLDVIEENEDTYIAESEIEGEIEIEKEMVKPLIKGKEIKRWKIPDSGKIVVYPYDVEEDGGEVMDKEEIEEKYPLAWDYFKATESELKSREGGKWQDVEDWHALTRVRSDNIEKFNQEKAVIAGLANQSKVAYDEGRDYIFVAGGYGLSLKDSADISYPYLVSVVNSRLLEWMVQETSSEFSGDSYSYGEKYIEDLPIPTGSQQKVITELSNDIIELVNSSRKENSEEIEVLENTIDFLIYEMYFDEFSDKLLQKIREHRDLEPKEKATKIKDSGEVEKAIRKMKEEDKVQMVEKGKIRGDTW